jgi:hypothetical protein
VGRNTIVPANVDPNAITVSRSQQGNPLLGCIRLVRYQASLLEPLRAIQAVFREPTGLVRRRR